MTHAYVLSKHELPNSRQGPFLFFRNYTRCLFLAASGSKLRKEKRRELKNWGTKWGNLGIRAARRISRQARSSEPTIRAGTKIRGEFMRQGVLLFVLWLMTSATRSADQVTLQNGDRLTGSIVKSDAKTLLVRTEFAGEVNIKWEAIAAMEASQPLLLVVRDGQTIVVRLTTSEGELEVGTSEDE